MSKKIHHVVIVHRKHTKNFNIIQTYWTQFYLNNEKIHSLNLKKRWQLQNKKYLRRIDVHIVTRLLSLLHHNSRIKKTNIALKCNMGYDKCVLYLDWLEMMDLIQRENDEDGFEVIFLSERGLNFLKNYTNTELDQKYGKILS